MLSIFRLESFWKCGVAGLIAASLLRGTRNISRKKQSTGPMDDNGYFAW